jgi:hypothetical protein
MKNFSAILTSFVRITEQLYLALSLKICPKCIINRTCAWERERERRWADIRNSSATARRVVVRKKWPRTSKTKKQNSKNARTHAMAHGACQKWTSATGHLTAPILKEMKVSYAFSLLFRPLRAGKRRAGSQQERDTLTSTSSYLQERVRDLNYTGGFLISRGTGSDGGWYGMDLVQLFTIERTISVSAHCLARSVFAKMEFGEFFCWDFHSLNDSATYLWYCTMYHTYIHTPLSLHILCFPCILVIGMVQYIGTIHHVPSVFRLATPSPRLTFSAAIPTNQYVLYGIVLWHVFLWQLRYFWVWYKYLPYNTLSNKLPCGNPRARVPDSMKALWLRALTQKAGPT